MKKVIIFLVIFSLFTGFNLSAQEVKPPAGAIGLLITTTTTAPMGIAGELFLGNMGIGLSFTTLPYYAEGAAIQLEPGAFLRLYFSDPGTGLYGVFGSTYWTTTSEMSLFDNTFDGVINFYGGLGFSNITGKSGNVRTAFEFGGRYSGFIFNQEMLSEYLVLPYISFSIGSVF